MIMHAGYFTMLATRPQTAERAALCRICNVLLAILRERDPARRMTAQQAYVTVRDAVALVDPHLAS
jgi:hypothetical protein